VLDAAEAVFASEDAYAETEGTGTPQRVKLFERGEENRPKLEKIRRLRESLGVLAW
jgi:hypothetical protein